MIIDYRVRLSLINYNLFKIIYKYNSILKSRLENKIIEEKLFIRKKWVKEINLIR